MTTRTILQEFLGHSALVVDIRDDNAQTEAVSVMSVVVSQAFQQSMTKLISCQYACHCCRCGWWIFYSPQQQQKPPDEVPPDRLHSGSLDHIQDGCMGLLPDT